MDIEHNLKGHLNYLCKETSKETKTTIEVLYKLHKHILFNQINKKATIRIDCVADFEFFKVWRFESIRLFLYNVGWRQENKYLILKNPQHLKLAIKTLYSFLEPKNDLNSIKSKPKGTDKSSKRLMKNLKREEDRSSQGFISEIDADLAENDCFQGLHSGPCPIITFESDTEIIKGKPKEIINDEDEYKTNEILNLKPQEVSTDSGNDLSFCSAQVSYPQSSVSDGSYQDVDVNAIQMESEQETSMINPFENAACFMQNALAAIVPLAGANLREPIGLMSHICNATRQMLHGVKETSACAISGFSKLSAIKFTKGPENSINITSPRFFGSARINIQTNRNKTVFNLITDTGPIASGISLTSAPDGSIVYSKTLSRTSLQYS